MTYWERRSLELGLLTQKKTDETVMEINRMFSQAVLNLNREVRTVFDRYQKSGGLTDTEARKLLNTAQTKQAREKLLALYNLADSKEAKRRIAAALDAPAYAYRIGMLEALANEVYAEGVITGVFAENQLQKRLVDIYEQSYYRRTFDIQQYTGEYYDFNRLSSNRLKAAISEKWNGKNYSECVWENTDKTAEALKHAVISGIMSGQSYEQIENAFAAVIGGDSDSGARYRMSRLVRTEVSYISGKATNRAYAEAGIDEYVFCATLDKHTCKDCGNGKHKSCAELDGKRFRVDEAEPGVNKQPMHPFCRCTDYPYIKGKAAGKRIARDPETGKTYLIPGDMTYGEWYAEYVERIDKSKKSVTLKINLQLFAKKSGDFPTVILPKSEYAHVMSEIATNLTDKQRKSKVFHKSIGNYTYTVENNGFGNYRIINKRKTRGAD